MKLIVLAALVALWACPAVSEQRFYELHVLFSDPVKIEPHTHEGFGPIKQPSLQECRTRRRAVTAYLTLANKDTPELKFKVFCVEYVVRGYDEALAAFKRKIGEES